jgi:hypothetical protein
VTLWAAKTAESEPRPNAHHNLADRYYGGFVVPLMSRGDEERGDVEKGRLQRERRAVRTRPRRRGQSVAGEERIEESEQSRHEEAWVLEQRWVCPSR